MAVGRTENCIRHGGGNRCEFDQVRFCRHQFSPTGELGYRGAVVGDRSTVQAYLIVEIIRFYC